MRVASGCDCLIDMLRERAAVQPADLAYTFLDSGEQEGARLTWSELDQRSRAIGAAISAQASAGARVIVMCPPGLDFVGAFFGCLYAGTIAVPTYPPAGAQSDRHVTRLGGMIADAGVSLVIAPRALHTRRHQIVALVPGLSRLPWIALEDADDSDGWMHPHPGSHAVAFLQYTSGSTAAPRGVMVTHGNVLHNLSASADLARHDESSLSVSWLPVNHDMGLIEGVLQPVYSGLPAYLMAPAAFLQRPARWLQAVSRLRATHSGGPNFAYDLCVRRVSAADRASLDLSSWQVAFNGAEPVRRTTMDAFQRAFGERGFEWQAFRPAYGLAESTLLVASSACGQEPVSVDVDRASLASGRVTIVESHRFPHAVPQQPMVKVWRSTALRHAQGVSSVPMNETGEDPRPHGATTGSVEHIRRGRNGAGGNASPVERGSECSQTVTMDYQDRGALVAVGTPAAGTEVVIADPDERTRCAARRVGEIWVASPSVALGYWGQPEISAATFRACLVTGEGPFLRTGDLGFLHDGHLFVTGRIKDVLIVRGLKHYPQDLELTAERAAPGLRPGCIAAFGIEWNGEERVAIVGEVEARRSSGPAADDGLEGTIAAVRQAIVHVHRLTPAIIILVEAGSVPKTTSGKLQRYACRAALVSGDLRASAQWTDMDEALGSSRERAAS